MAMLSFRKPSAEAAAPTGITPSLIDTLTQQHRELEALHADLVRMANEERFREIPDALLAFKTKLDAHVLAENVRFYAVMERQLAGDALNAEVLHGFRKTMGQLVRQVLEVCTRWRQSGVDAMHRYEFLRDLDAVGKALALRTECEEQSLYPLARS